MDLKQRKINSDKKSLGMTDDDCQTCRVLCCVLRAHNRNIIISSYAARF